MDSMVKGKMVRDVDGNTEEEEKEVNHYWTIVLRRFARDGPSESTKSR
jgi:hypothetical protein